MVIQSSNVCGPFSKDEWTTMLHLKESISWMRQKDTKKFLRAINKETQMYKELKGRRAA